MSGIGSSADTSVRLPAHPERARRPVLVLSPMPARTFADAGWTKAEVRDALFQHTRTPARRARTEIEAMRMMVLRGRSPSFRFSGCTRTRRPQKSLGLRGQGSTKRQFVLPSQQVGLSGTARSQKRPVGMNGELATENADGFSHSGENLGI